MLNINKQYNSKIDIFFQFKTEELLHFIKSIAKLKLEEHKLL